MENATAVPVSTKVQLNEQVIAALNGMTLEVHDNGYAEVRSTWHTDHSLCPFTRVYIVRDGSAWLSDPEQTFRMEKNRVYVIPAGVPCSYGCDTVMHKFYFHLNVYKPDRCDLLRGCSRIGCIPVEADFVAQMFRYYQGEGYLDAVMLRSQLLSLLGQYLQQNDVLAPIPSSYSDVVAQTIDYIHKHLSARLRNEELAKRLFVSRTYLTDRFRKETGVSLGKYIDDQLMFEAQLRLCTTDASIRTISKDLGFSDQFYFSRRFKELCGVTPLQYRKNNR